MSSFAVNDCLHKMWHAGYQRFAIFLGDFSDLNFFNCLSQILSTWQLFLYVALSFIIVPRFSVGLRSSLFHGHSSTEILFFFRNSVATFDQWQGYNLAWRSWKEGSVLFNDTLNTFYLQLYGVRHMVKDHSDSERGNPLPPHGLLFPINSKGSFICTIPQTG